MWPSVSLGEIAKNLDNRRIPLNSVEREKKSSKKLYPYIGANNIIDYIGEYLFDERILCVAEDGGSWGPGQQCAVIYEGRTWVNNHAHVLVENGKAKLEYLRYFLNRSDLNKYITGTTRGKLTRSAMDSILVPLPAIQDQIRIINVLSKAESLISQRKESIRLLDEMLKSTFLEMFGDIRTNHKAWRSDKLGNLYPKGSIVDGPFGSAINVKEDYVEDGEIPVIRTVNIKRFNFSFENLRFIRREKYDLIKRSNVQPGDILISKVGTIGNVCMFPDKYNEAVLSTTGSTRLRNTNPEVNFNYLLYYLDVYKPYMIQMASTGVQPFLNLGHVKSFKVLLPPVNLQTQFAQIVEKTEALKAHYQASLEKMENLYVALSQRAFSRV